MIGGIDLYLKGRTHYNDADLIVRFIRWYWKKAIIDVPGVYNPTPIWNPGLFPVKKGDEFFIYANLDAYESWTEHGRTTKNANDLIFIIVESDCISFVVDNSISGTFFLVKELRKSIRRNRRGYNRSKREEKCPMISTPIW